jgi:hypothetical protein
MKGADAITGEKVQGSAVEKPPCPEPKTRVNDKCNEEPISITQGFAEELKISSKPLREDDFIRKECRDGGEQIWPD